MSTHKHIRQRIDLKINNQLNSLMSQLHSDNVVFMHSIIYKWNLMHAEQIIYF